MLRVNEDNNMNNGLPVAVIGAGPIGLAAAANLVENGITPMIFEAGEHVAASIRDWGHVRFFTPWSYLIDPAGRRLLEEEGKWKAPSDEDYVPLAGEFVEEYLAPLAALPSIEPHVYLQHKVVSVSRVGHDRMKDGDRQNAPFLVVAHTPEGAVRYEAAAVLDASGTWTTPNPLGAAGVLADGEAENADRIRYGMPDILGHERARYEGKRVLVVGSGHSAIGSVLELTELTKESDTQVAWAVRKTDPSRLWGGGGADELKARGALGTRVYEAVHSGAVTLLQGLSISALRNQGDGVVVVDVDRTEQVEVDEIVVATGSRPDLEMLRELRLELDGPTESTRALGPLIDPNHHSCGSVPPHGVDELKQPEANFFMVGMKSYGRAPTFLARTGYEQVRSIVADLAGDHEGAREIKLTLPQTGVCSSDLAYGGKQGSSSCC